MNKSFLTVTLLLGIASHATAEEITYTSHIKPLFDRRCAGCHGQSAAPEYQAFKADKQAWLSRNQGPRMDSYSHLIFYTAWPDTGALMRRLDDGTNTTGGKAGNMYQHLGSNEEERKKNLALFKGWIGNWNLKKWPEITKDELNGITVKY